VLRRQGAVAVCWICGETATTVDHVIPRSKGGTDADANLLPACLSCNSRRGNDDNPFEIDEPVRPAGLALSERWRS
jgi:5-methylcytosine-specific restriction endonuclease McrA